MSGIPDDNRPAFRAASRVLREMGFEVTSPDELDERCPAAGTSWADYLRRDVPWVLQADMGVALPGWRNSKGATLEATILGTFGVPVFELVDGDLYPVDAAYLPKPQHPVTVPIAGTHTQ